MEKPQCSDAQGSPSAEDCQDVLDTFLRLTTDNQCDNYGATESTCRIMTFGSDVGDHVCKIELCGAGQDTIYNCPVAAAAAQEIVSTCNTANGVSGSITIRASSANGKVDQTIRILPPTLAHTRRDRDQNTMNRTAQISHPAIGSRKISRRDVPFYKSWPVPYTGLELRFSSIMGVKDAIITQKDVDNQIARFVDDWPNIPDYVRHKRYSIPLEPTTSFLSGANADISLAFVNRRDKGDLWNTGIVQALVQALNDDRNSLGNPSYLSTTIYRFGSGDAVPIAQFTLQINIHPKTDVGTGPGDNDDDVFTCGADLCDLGILKDCEDEPYSVYRTQQQGGGEGWTIADIDTKRRQLQNSLNTLASSHELNETLENQDPAHMLLERDPTRYGGVRTTTTKCFDHQFSRPRTISFKSKPYPGIGQWTPNEERYGRALGPSTPRCDDPTIGLHNMPLPGTSASLLDKYCTEHIVELQTLGMFFDDAADRKLPGYPQFTGLPAGQTFQMWCEFVDDFMNKDKLPVSQTQPKGVTVELGITTSRIMQRTGWRENWRVFVFLGQKINSMKGAVSLIACTRPSIKTDKCR